MSSPFQIFFRGYFLQCICADCIIVCLKCCMTDKARCGGSITPMRRLISQMENSDYFCQDPAPTIL